jgi:folate-dependent phosphoribosylglycinamide formyltransferase PurN
VKKVIYGPLVAGSSMNIVCFISGSGTNYREIVYRNPDQHYLVFTNRPGCGGVKVAKENKHEVIELSHIPYIKAAKNRCGSGAVPRNCPERVEYEQQACRLFETKLGQQPDLICLAGYDQWLTDWTVERYYPRILNVHPGDTTKGYDGLHWIPAAKAIIAGDKTLRSTLFIVDKGEDTGPVLVQSAPLDIVQTLTVIESKGSPGLHDWLKKIENFIESNNVTSYSDFSARADKALSGMMELVCGNLQEALKVAGDWKIYPFAVHELIGRGRVELDGRQVYVDNVELPAYGFRMDVSRC